MADTKEYRKLIRRLEQQEDGNRLAAAQRTGIELAQLLMRENEPQEAKEILTRTVLYSK